MRVLDIQAPWLRANGLCIESPNGRPLLRNLNLVVDDGKVAIVGRNGSGKSTLLRTLSGDLNPASGSVHWEAPPFLIPQEMTLLGQEDARRLLGAMAHKSSAAASLNEELSSIGLGPMQEIEAWQAPSPGELRKLHLVALKVLAPGLVLLDEPSQDLDEQGHRWLCNWIAATSSVVVLVSHDRALLERMEHFFVVTEIGCSYFRGTVNGLEHHLEEQEQVAQKHYVRRLNTLVQKEAHSEKYRRRRERKKNVGRVRELGRMTPRSRLNQKRSYAQEKQGRIAKIREARIGAAREWAKAARRSLAVQLPLEATFPDLPPASESPIIELREVSISQGAKQLVRELDLTLSRERIAVVGPNGSGKTSLLEVILGDDAPDSGTARRQRARIGSVAQGGTDWLLEESLLEHLLRIGDFRGLDNAAEAISSHSFPLALAERPMRSLSPGERVRAALLCLFQRRPAVEVLVLDEPSYCLDMLGVSRLCSVLNGWPGGLVVTSHESSFLSTLRMDHRVELGAAPVRPADGVVSVTEGNA